MNLLAVAMISVGLVGFWGVLTLSFYPQTGPLYYSWKNAMLYSFIILLVIALLVISSVLVVFGVSHLIGR